MSAFLDCSSCDCESLRAENARLKTRLASLAHAHTEPPSTALRSELLDDAAPRAHRFLEPTRAPIVVTPNAADTLREALVAYDRAQGLGMPLHVHGQALRIAASHAGIPSNERSTDWNALIAASRELVSRVA